MCGGKNQDAKSAVSWIRRYRVPLSSFAQDGRVQSCNQSRNPVPYLWPLVLKLDLFDLEILCLLMSIYV